ncbi:MAG: DUF1488 family protein [Pseudomonadota bacterium]|nr:DUF1488 family protein [Pseudomonadota bacterium]
MSSTELTNITAPDLTGLHFTALHDGQTRSLFLSAEALEDIEYQHYDSPAALLEAFERQRALITEHSARALAANPGDGEVRIESLM